jgi:HEAT repeat protein
LWGGTPDIAKLKRNGRVDRLVRALQFEDVVTDRDGRVVDLGAGVRKTAVAALADVDGDAARGGLITALRDPEEDVREAATWALRERCDPETVDPLLDAVTHWTAPEQAIARGHALEALVAIGDPDLPRRVAYGLLARPEELNVADRELLRRVKNASAPDSTRRAADPLVAALADRSAAPRAREMLLCLAPVSVPPLVDKLRDPTVAREAAVALGFVHDARAVAPLCEVLSSSAAPPVRAAAAWALGEIRHPRAVGALLDAAVDDDFSVRAEATTAFDRLGNVAVVLATKALSAPAQTNGEGLGPDPLRQPINGARFAAELDNPVVGGGVGAAPRRPRGRLTED